MRKPFIAGNWKMHKTIDETVDLVKALRAELDSVDGCDVAICPPFVALAAAREALAGSTIGLGAQNVHWEEKGAFTGAISPPMLEGLCEYVIIGHSERRNVFGETDEWINRKLHAALAHGFKPILCVGENLEQMRLSASVKKDLINAEREFIYQLLRDGKISDEARRRIEYELDLEEASVANRGKAGGGWI